MSDVPNGRQAVNALYGNPAKSDGSLNEAWERANIVVVPLPYPMVTNWDGKTVERVQIHRLVAPDLTAVLTDIAAQVRVALRIEAKIEIPVATMKATMEAKFGPKAGTPENDKLVTGSYDQMVEARFPSRMHTLGLSVLGGTYNFRKIVGGKGLSLHAYGAAIDLDPSNNALGNTTGGMPGFAVKSFKARGWVWGGDFRGRKDFMHYQRASGC